MESSRLLEWRPAAPLLLILFVCQLAISAWPQAARKTEKKPVFTDEDLQVEKAAGKGIISTAPDSTQTKDSSVPVVVKLINTDYGGGQHVGRIKISQAQIENRDQKVTQSIQLRWAIAKKAEPDIVLLEGVTPIFKARIAPYNAPLLDIPPIYYNKIVRPLLKDGLMDDGIRLTVGIQEVRFEDGTKWQRIRQAAFLKATFSRPPPDSKPQPLKPGHFSNISNSPSPKPQPLVSNSCEGQPRFTASAILSALFPDNRPALS